LLSMHDMLASSNDGFMYRDFAPPSPLRSRRDGICALNFYSGRWQLPP
jgi:hypothetical protein